ncbi:hypothetical protein HYPSUDRAFT_137710, partial [Hypholoma sublateritium FD-334 SS-4]
CIECWGGSMYCAKCIIQAHRTLFLYHIQKWNGKHFEKVALKHMGLRMQLGHPHGEECVNPTQCPSDDFVIIHSNGLHEVGLDFCGCGKDNQLHTVQLLRARLFPATIVNPKTAATMEVLDLFSILSYESKMSAFQFYHSLGRLTDNTGIHEPKDRYSSFLRVVHEWRHLMMLKRAGRGHDVKGVAGTKQGECAVLCPACPQPGKNMSAGWKERPENLRYLDTLFISIDANFRLKRKNVSNNEVDPGLSQGWSYFVEETAYRDHIKNYISEVEPKSTCSQHDAVNLSSTKPGQGHAATSVGAVVCARHDFKRPTAVAQLQRGERYCNMDYIFHETMKDSQLQTFVISYDIVCQWSVHLRQRMLNYIKPDPTVGSEFFLYRNDAKMTFLVPKFHLPAHISKCRMQFSFNLTKHVGRTEGEAPERGWVGPNALAPSTKEMGPGSCRDTLDFHFGDANHKKVIGLGASLLRKIMAAAREMAEHTIGHQQLESTISERNLTEWTAAVEAWEEDTSQPNPFAVNSTGPTVAAVLRQLAEEERKQLEANRDMSLDDTVTPSVLIATGITLENEQRAYKNMCAQLWEHSMDRQHTKLILRGNTLIRKIEAWSKYQLLYMPAISRLKENELQKFDHSVELKAHEIPLWLPSQIRSQIDVPKHYRRLEFDLCIPQASEALDELRAQLQVRAHLFKVKDRFTRGQAANTRARGVLDGVQKKIDQYALEYRTVYGALCCLGSLLREEEWRDVYLPLQNDNIRDLSEGKVNQSEGRREISWIWRTTALDQIDKPEEVRVEWAKSRARAHRFTEEVLLLTEEMLRVPTFLKWKSDDWKAKHQ